MNCAFNADNSLGVSSIEGLPIFRAGIDSCCTASCTDSLDKLVNVRECDETFKVADGKESKCTAVGDMPVLAKTANGEIHRFTLTNVRYVPNFQYTLISVTQAWDEQRIKSSFADAKRLEFRDGTIIPFDERFKLCAITIVSEPLLLNSIKEAGTIEGAGCKYLLLLDCNLN